MAATRHIESKPARSPGKPLHPAIGLIGGFTFIVGAALLVHLVFNLVL